MSDFCTIVRGGDYGIVGIHFNTGEVLEVYTAEETAESICEKVNSAFRQHAARIRSDALKFAVSTLSDQRGKYRYPLDAVYVFNNIMHGEIEEAEHEAIE